MKKIKVTKVEEPHTAFESAMRKIAQTPKERVEKAIKREKEKKK